MVFWIAMLATAIAPIWIKAPYWYAPYTLMMLAFGLLAISYVVMFLTYEHTMRVMRPHFETKLKRRKLYEYVVCFLVTALLLTQAHWWSAALTGSVTISGIVWRVLLAREMTKYRHTRH